MEVALETVVEETDIVDNFSEEDGVEAGVFVEERQQAAASVGGEVVDDEAGVFVEEQAASVGVAAAEETGVKEKGEKEKGQNNPSEKEENTTIVVNCVDCVLRRERFFIHDITHELRPIMPKKNGHFYVIEFVPGYDAASNNFSCMAVTDFEELESRRESILKNAIATKRNVYLYPIARNSDEQYRNMITNMVRSKPKFLHNFCADVWDMTLQKSLPSVHEKRLVTFKLNPELDTMFKSCTPSYSTVGGYVVIWCKAVSRLPPGGIVDGPIPFIFYTKYL